MFVSDLIIACHIGFPQGPTQGSGIVGFNGFCRQQCIHLLPGIYLEAGFIQQGVPLATLHRRLPSLLRGPGDESGSLF